MAIGGFRSPDLDYKGWLETVKESDQIKITAPIDNKVFFVDLGKSKKEITVSGIVRGKKKDLIKLKAKAARNNIPYQTLINLLINSYTEGKTKLSL